MIGAMPIVMPTLTKTWKTSAATQAAETTAPKRLGASANVYTPRQTTSA